MFDVRETDIKLRGDNNIQSTQSLFIEFNRDAPYTLQSRDKDKEGRKVLSIYQVYMDSVDEYDAAMRIVGNLEHWRKLCSLNWFMEGIPEKGCTGLKQWREDMQRRDQSLAKAKLLEAVNEGNVNASRFLYEKSSSKEKQVRKKEKEVMPTSSAVANFKKFQ